MREFHTLQRYAMKMLKDPDDRGERVLLAWQESIRLGPKSSMLLLVNYMKWRARENKRSIVGAHAGGKSLQDVWHHDPVSLDAQAGRDDTPLKELVSSYDRDPFGSCVVSGFADDFSETQRCSRNGSSRDTHWISVGRQYLTGGRIDFWISFLDLFSGPMSVPDMAH